MERHVLVARHDGRPGDTDAPTLSSLSCVTAGDCTAVGDVETDVAGYEALSERP